MTSLRSAALVMVLLVAAGCAGGSPRFTDRPLTPETTGPAAQVADLEGELLVAPPEKSAEQAMKENPERALRLSGLGEVPPAPPAVVLPPAPDTTVAAAPAPDTTVVTAPAPGTTVATTPVLPGGPRKEYQVQVAITPSLDDAEKLKEQLEPLFPDEEVFIFFTRPYYRIRVGHNAAREGADRLLARLRELGYTRAMVIPFTIMP